MALAIHFDGLIRDGVVKNYADLARLGGVSRARITQIMNLLNLPPWKQEELLFLEGGQGRTGVTERVIRNSGVNWHI
jgi:alkylated DNA nucleotide flippase Atl1